MTFRIILVVLLITFTVYQNNFAQLKINEVCASNDGSYYNHEHEDPDWLELYNDSDQAVNLKNWKVYDENSIDKAFTLPDTTIPPHGYIIIHCSGLDGFGKSLQVIESQAPELGFNKYDACDYYYLPFSGDISFSCRIHNIDFYNQATQFSLMMRESIDKGSVYYSITIKKLYEVLQFIHLRSATDNWVNRYGSDVKVDFQNTWFKLERKDDIYISYFKNNRDEWENDDVRPPFEYADDMLFGFAIASNDTNTKTSVSISDIMINDKPYKLSDFQFEKINHNQKSEHFFSHEIHSNFKIKNDSGILYLWDSDQNLVDSISVSKNETNISIGRYPDGNSNIGIMSIPSPGRKNKLNYISITDPPIVNISPGLYKHTVNILFTNEDEQLDIYYTLDGSEPTDTSKKYIGETIEIEKTTVLKAISFKNNYIPSKVNCFDYIINENTKLPVITINTDPENLTSQDHGIFHKYNYYRNIEVPAHFHYFEPETGREYSSYMGLKLHGSTSKLTVPQKSIRFYARQRYGNNYFEFPFFDNDYSNYKRLVLRNAGQDWFYSYLRNSFVNLLSNNIDKNLAIGFQPCVVYINGEYWGLMVLQERIDEKMIATRYDIDDDDINFFEGYDYLLHGNYDAFKSLKDTLEYLEPIFRIRDVGRLIHYFVYYWNFNYIVRDYDSFNFIN